MKFLFFIAIVLQIVSLVIENVYAISSLRQQLIQNLTTDVKSLENIPHGSSISKHGAVDTSANFVDEGVSGTVKYHGYITPETNLSGKISSQSGDVHNNASGSIAATADIHGEGTTTATASLKKGLSSETVGEVGANSSVYMRGDVSRTAGRGALQSKLNAQGEVAAELHAKGTGTIDATATLKQGVHAGVVGIVGANGTVYVAGSATATAGNEVIGGDAQGSGNAEADIKATAQGQGTLTAEYRKGLVANATGDFDASVQEQGQAQASAKAHFLDCDKEISLCGSATGTASEKLQASANGAGGVTADATWDGAGANVSGHVGVSASADAQLSGHIVLNDAQASGTAKASAQAYAKAKGTAVATYNFKDLKGSIGAEGSAVAAADVSAQASGSVSIGQWLKANGQVGISYGAQVGVGGGFIVSQDKCTFIYSGQLQAEASGGVSGSGNVQVNPCELLAETAKNGEAAVKQIGTINTPLGQQCLWGPNCAGFTLFGEGADCCSFQCAQKVNINGKYECEEGLIHLAQKINSVPSNGECNIGAVCAGHSFMGPGAACCNGFCQDRVQDFTGLYMCPDLAHPIKPLGGSCSISAQCEGYTVLGAGSSCCEGTCQSRLESWDGVYECPSEAVLKKPIGASCVVGAECEGYTFANQGVGCCSFTCQEREYKSGFFGIHYWVCP